MENPKELKQAIAYRRSCRVYTDQQPDPEVIRACVEQAVLAPNSSNMQLWEFYHVTDAGLLEKLSHACMSQSAARTAAQMLVVVVRKDLWSKRARANKAFIENSFKQVTDTRLLRRRDMALNYYGKLMPFLYFDFLGLFGLLKYALFWIGGWFRPLVRQVRQSDMRIVAHKSAALAAQNFMLAMAAEGLDTCPMEGFDSLRVKRLLKLPAAAEINMVISCGYRDEKGIYGPRFRVPFDEVYRRV